METPGFIGIGEAAKLLGLSRSTVQKLVDQGRLVAMRTAGGHRRILRTSLVQLRNHMHPERSVPPAGVLHAQAGGADSGLRVMVVDDDGVAMAFMRALLAQRFPDIECIAASDGLEAVVQLERQRPHIVITDLHMKPYDGFRLARLLDQHDDYRHICVIAITALPDDAIARRGGLPPHAVVYPKPVPVERLTGYLEAHVQVHRQLRSRNRTPTHDGAHG